MTAQARLSREAKEMESKLASITETASILSVSKDTVRRLIASGKLHHVRIAGRVLVNRKAIDALCVHGDGRRVLLARGKSAATTTGEAV